MVRFTKLHESCIGVAAYHHVLSYTFLPTREMGQGKPCIAFKDCSSGSLHAKDTLKPESKTMGQTYYEAFDVEDILLV